MSTFPASPRSQRSSDSFSDDGGDPESALILVHDQEDQDDIDASGFEFSSDEEEREEDEFEHTRGASVTPLSPAAVFVYLLSPLLKLGALLSIFDVSYVPLKFLIPGVLFFATLCTFSRQIWYMLSRYVRRTDIEDVFLETFAKGRAREGRRDVLRLLVRFCTAILRVLLVALYLRSSADVVVRYIPDKIPAPRFVATTALALVISPFSFTSSLASNRVLYTTWLSVATYVAWFACVAYLHTHNMFAPLKEPYPPKLWQGLSIVAFAFTTSYTMPLYAALKGTYQPGQPRTKRSRSFRLLSLASIVVAVALILPPLIFNSTSDNEVEQPSRAMSNAVIFLAVATLMLGIPNVMTTTPNLPVPLGLRRRTDLPVSRIVLFFLAYLASFTYGSAERTMCDILLVLAFLSTFTIPAFLHIVIHNFRRPLSIVLPGTPGMPSHPGMHRSDSYNDELLQRKERTLQRRRFARRILWDIGVWTLLIPVSGGGLVWAAGRVAAQW